MAYFYLRIVCYVPYLSEEAFVFPVLDCFWGLQRCAFEALLLFQISMHNNKVMICYIFCCGNVECVILIKNALPQAPKTAKRST